MKQYIDKAAVMAEIDDIESIAISEFNSNHSRYSEAGLDICHRLKKFINNLNVKEVDLGI